MINLLDLTFTALHNVSSNDNDLCSFHLVSILQLHNMLKVVQEKKAIHVFKYLKYRICTMYVLGSVLTCATPKHLCLLELAVEHY